VLARLADLAPDTASDHSGALLRFVDHGQVAQVRARLNELGYESAEVDPSESRALPESEWYMPADLSREEARVLASRIAPAFIREHAIDSAAAQALQDRIESALFGCFVANPIGSGAPAGSLRAECAGAVAVAASEILGPDMARALGQFVDRWLHNA
jgi:hypothetical protein